MFRFIKKIFIGLLSVCTIKRFGVSLVFNYKKPIKCLSLNNQPCQTKPTLVNISFGETLSYPFTVGVNKCGGSCNTDYPYARVCVPIKVKNMPGKNEKRFIVQHKSC